MSSLALEGYGAARHSTILNLIAVLVCPILSPAHTASPSLCIPAYYFPSLPGSPPASGRRLARLPTCMALWFTATQPTRSSYSSSPPPARKFPN